MHDSDFRHFFIVGAQRSGTTYLYRLLDEHPEICMAKPIRPEPKYFLRQRASDDERRKEYLEKYFHDIPQKACRVLGEKSTSYYESEETAKNIAASFPDAKILFCLRDPVERAISNFFFSKNNGLETRTLKEVFLERKAPPPHAFETSVDPFDYLARGEYIRFIETYRNHFPRQNIRILLFEELTRSLESLRELYRFLEVSSRFVPESFGRAANPSTKDERIPSEVREALSRHYAPFNERLAREYGLDLTVWGAKA